MFNACAHVYVLHCMNSASQCTAVSLKTDDCTKQPAEDCVYEFLPVHKLPSLVIHTIQYTQYGTVKPRDNNNTVIFTLASPVMEETGGNGVGRLMEATGAPPMVNNCFSLLRYYCSKLFPFHEHSCYFSFFVLCVTRKGGYIVLVGLPKV